LTRDLLVLGQLETSKLAKKGHFSFTPNSQTTSGNATALAAAAAAQAAVHNNTELELEVGGGGGGGGGDNIMMMNELIDASITVGGMKSTSSSTSLLKNKVRASAAIRLSSKCLLVRGFDVIASFKPTSTDNTTTTTNDDDDVLRRRKVEEGTKYKEDGVAVYNMLKLDSECTRIVNSCGQ
jgi:hypothetical protein